MPESCGRRIGRRSLGEKIWRTRFNADSAIIGQSVRLNGEAAIVIGVMPEGFAFPIAQELWVPLRVDSADPEQSEKMPLQIFGRLREGISIEQAQAEMKAIAELLARDHPETHANISAHVMPYVEAYTNKDTRVMLWSSGSRLFSWRRPGFMGYYLFSFDSVRRNWDSVWLSERGKVMLPA